MTVKITRDNVVKTFTVDEMEEGKAYEDMNGIVYICNPYKDLLAFSICGRCMVHRENPSVFKEVDLEITVKG